MLPARILCPTDMSDLSRIAVRCGLAWASRFGAKVFVLTARELTLPPRYFTADQIATLVKQAEAAEDQVRADLEAWVDEIGPTGVAVEALTAPGPADRAILRAIEVVRPDLVVMGTHGLSGYRRFLMGSTTERVVREIAVPLLTVRDSCRCLVAGDGRATRLEVRRILCAAADPKQPGTNLAAVAELARAFGAELTVVHSLEVPPTVREDIVGHLRELVRSRAAHVNTRIVVPTGPASSRILEQAAADEADLIVVGGRLPEAGMPAFGSTAVRVMRQAPCPVLALPGLGGSTV
jgi:nucleotide-binding universal stress UspA family protein